MTERVQLQMQMSEMKFLQKKSRVTMFDKVRNTVIRESLNIESLLLRIERSRLIWCGRVGRMPQKRFPK